MSKSELKQAVLAFLKKIEQKLITIEPTTILSKVYAGNVIYKASNGWEMTIFNDANSWDYIDNIKTDNGFLITFDDIDEIIELRNYYPPIDIIREVYQIAEENIS